MKWIAAFVSVVTVTLGMLLAFRHEMASYNRWVADVLDPETPLPLPPPTEGPTVIAQISRWEELAGGAIRMLRPGAGDADHSAA